MIELLTFLRNHSPEFIGLILIIAFLLCAKELYAAFRLDKITINAYNKKKEGDVE